MRPADGIVREGIWASPVIYMIHHLRSSTNNAVQSHHLVVSPLGSPFGAGAIVAYDVDEQGIIEFAHVA